MDILYLVDRLEAVIHAGQRMPFTNKIMVDERECLDIVDQMRIVVPEEIKQARRVSQDRDRITSQAREAAERITARAEQRAGEIIAERGLLQMAEDQAAELVGQAETHSRDIREGADDYALQVLQALGQHLEAILDEVRHGMEAISDQPPPLLEEGEEPVPEPEPAS